MLTLDLFGGPLTQDVVEQITLVEAADQSPILAMMLAAGQQQGTNNPKPMWYTSSLGGRRTQINNGGTAYSGATTTLVVDDASIFKPNHIVVAEATGEILLVLTSNGTTQITVKRGFGSTGGSAASVADDAYLSVVATASGEGAPAPAGDEVGKTQHSNTVQLFREAVELTGTLLRTTTNTESERQRQRRDKYEQFIHNIEQAIIHGQQSDTGTDAASRVARTMGGLREKVVTNVTSGLGAMTRDEFEAALEGCMAHGSGRKVLFAGTTAVAAINKLYRGDVRYTNPQAPVGLKVDVIRTAFGECELMVHRGLRGGFAGDVIGVDLGQLIWRPLEGGNPGGGDFPQNGRIQFRDNLQEKGADSVKDEWFAEGTLQYGNEEAHCQLRGITGATV